MLVLINNFCFKIDALNLLPFCEWRRRQRRYEKKQQDTDTHSLSHSGSNSGGNFGLFVLSVN